MVDDTSVARDCGGHIHNITSQSELQTSVKRLFGRSLINIGIRYGAVNALLSRIPLFDNDRYIEITMVNVNKNARRTGEFRRFIQDMIHVGRMCNKGVLLGAVMSSRMLQICKKQKWPQFSLEPTSYVVLCAKD